MRVPIASIVIVGLSLCSGGTDALIRSHNPHPKHETVDHSPARHREAGATSAFGKLPLYFVENRGQADPSVAYYIQGRDRSIYFTNKGFILTMVDSKEGQPRQPRIQPASPASVESHQSQWSLSLEFVDSDASVRPDGLVPTDAVMSYFKGPRDQWKGGLKTFSSIVYRNLWPGIDLVYAGAVNRMKYSFRVKPGADPAQIQLAYRGESSMTITGGGELEVGTPFGVVRDERPVSYQDIGGQHSLVSTEYELSGKDDGYGFHVGAYDHDKELVIDPAVLVYCGYLGSSGSLVDGQGVAVDVNSGAYICGLRIPPCL
jgi:hypothetical protein